MDKIQVTFINNNQEITKGTFDYGTKVYSVLDNFNIPTDSIYAVKINNEVRSLEDQIQYTSTIEPVLNNSKTGSAIYRRSLCLLLATACHTLFPEKRLLVGHSLGHGYFYTFEDEDEVSNDVINQLRKEMEKLIEQNIPITTKDISYQEATQLFEKLNLKETRKQLQFICEPSIKINTINDFSDIYFEPLVRSTGVLKVFDILQYKNGFLLRFPRTSDPERLDLFKDEPKLYEIFSKYKEWGKRVNVTSAASLNQLIKQRQINDFIEITETFQQKNISNIASQIIEKGTVKVVLIAGPSSSGKTTSAKKLALELRAMGYQPKIISLDCYYLGRDKTPLDEEGKPDFECLEALNIELLNQNLVDLFAGKEVCIPSYDFHSGTSYFDENCKMTLEENEILIMEGIHGLNDKLTPKVPAEYKFKIYLSALTQLNLDDHNRILPSGFSPTT